MTDRYDNERQRGVRQLPKRQLCLALEEGGSALALSRVLAEMAIDRKGAEKCRSASSYPGVQAM